MAIAQGRKVLIGITGGIASYKVAEVVSTLAKAGAEVQVVLTGSAEQFVTPLTFATLSRRPAYTDREFWQPQHGRPLHITLAEWAEVILLAPLTANTLGKLVHGIADNLLLNILIASTCPVVCAPAMNTTMWQNPAVQQNWQSLLADVRYHALPPIEGVLACDTVGTGKMAEPSQILTLLESVLWTGGKRDLQGKKVLVSGGGTREFIDPVRFLGNPATGKQGIAIALAACDRGAEVTLVLANGTVPYAYPGLTVIGVTTSAELETVMLKEFPQADITVMNAAVSDVKPQLVSPHKLPKQELPPSLALFPVPDIVQMLAHQKSSHQVLVGFAAQTGTIDEFLPLVQAKLMAKGLDAIVANRVDQGGIGFGSGENQVLMVGRDRQEVTPRCSKLEIAHRLWDFLHDMAGY
ncbi:MAG: bifunctional phosphopantothenoylcysteine decarboxylase/phosphopantothenate--cysteine ligase CoaBC [Pseudanabaenaceae cyanobacterium]